MSGCCHKGITKEILQRNIIILNKTKAIVGQDRGTHISILKNIRILQCSWNSALIGDADIPLYVAAVSREFKFQLDINMGASPNLEDNNH